MIRIFEYLVVCLPTLAFGCSAGADGPTAGPLLAIEVVPLALPGVVDAEWHIAVHNNAAQLVWEANITSVDFGDGAGAVSYVGPCDAQSNLNNVTLTLLSLSDLSGVIDEATYVDPTPLTKQVTCVANEDTQVVFNLVVVRDATQGFFDVAVSFSDIFCSAKVDCVTEFLHNAGAGGRDVTAVVGLACTGGVNADTHLYWNDLTIACGGPGGPRSAAIDPSGDPGNQGALAPFLYQHAIYRGEESLGALNKGFWNIALGLDLAGLAGADLTGCNLTSSATASDGGFVGGLSPSGIPWPYIAIDVNLTDGAGALVCTESPLGSDEVDTAFGDPEGEDPYCYDYDPAGDTVTDHCGGTPEPSAASGTIVFSRRVTGANPRDLYTMDPDGANIAQVTDTIDDENNPSWSPDKSQIAYLRIGGSARDVFRVDDGGVNVNITQLTSLSSTNVGNPDWSSVDEEVFYDAFGDLHSVDAVTLTMTSFNAGAIDFHENIEANPSLSPDGTLIAYRRCCSPLDVVVRPVDGSGSVTPLTQLTGFFDNSAWSPDGTQLAVQHADGIYVIDPLDVAAPILVADNAAAPAFNFENPSWSPDGAYIVFDNSDDLFIVAADGSEANTPTNITNTPGFDEQKPDWQ